MTIGDDQPVRDNDLPPPRVAAPPTLMWIMLGALLVLAFVTALVVVFEVPALKGASRGPVQRMPGPPEQSAPANPTTTPPPTGVS